MEELRLEPLIFVGYQHQQTGLPGVAPHVSGLVHLVTPQGAPVLLHPGPVPASPRPPLGSANDITNTSSSTSQKPLPPPPDMHGAANGKVQASPSDTAAAAEESDALLKVLTTTSAPPENFQVEFVLSSSSFSSSSSSPPSSSNSAFSSRSSSARPTRDTPTVAEGQEGATREAAKQSNDERKSGEAAAREEAAPLATSEMTQITHRAEADLESVHSGDDVALPPHYEHGLELFLRAEWNARVNAALTQCALKLFNGRLPQQQQQQQQQQQEANTAAQPKQEMWSEAVHYHRVVVMGYDTAGAAFLMAVPFAQTVPPPQSWRLCPLPLLLCPVSQLTRLYTEAQEKADAAEQQPMSPHGRTPSYEYRYPVLSRSSREGGAGSLQGSRTASPPSSSVTSAPPRGGLPLSPPPPPPPPLPPSSSFSSLSPPVTALTRLGTSAAGSPTSANAYLSPPLRWNFTAIGHIPELNLQQLFQITPDRVYRLTRPAGEVVFVGVACGVPWVREAVRVAGSAAPLDAGRGIALHTHANTTSTTAPTHAAGPPAGYRWKDRLGFVMPLVCCHDARDLRVRHGLVEETTTGTASTSTAATTRVAGPLQSGVEGSGDVPAGEGAPAAADTALPSSQNSTTSSPSSAAVVCALSPANGEVSEAAMKADGGADQQQPQQQQSQQQQDSEKRGVTPTPPPPPPSSLASPPPASSAPLFVKEGTVVFVPGRFNVMLQCIAKPSLLAEQFGVVHGDRLLPRASKTPTTTSSPVGVTVTVMGVHNRNVLVVLADGERQATQIAIRRGVQEVAELFQKVAGAPLPPPALPLEEDSLTQSSTSMNDAATLTCEAEKDGTHEGAARNAEAACDGADSAVEKEEEEVAKDVSDDAAPERAESTNMCIKERNEVTVEGAVAAAAEEEGEEAEEEAGDSATAATTATPDAVKLTIPNATERDPDTATPFMTHADEGEEEDGGVEVTMPSDPLADAQATPTLASTTPRLRISGTLPPPPSSSSSCPLTEKDAPVQPPPLSSPPVDTPLVATGEGEAAEEDKKGDAEREEKGEATTALIPTEAAVENPMGESDEETVPSPTALLLSHAEDVTVTSANAPADQSEQQQLQRLQRESETLGTAKGAENEEQMTTLDDGGAGSAEAAAVSSLDHSFQNSTAAAVAPAVAATSPAHEEEEEEQQPPLMPVSDSSLPATQAEDKRECSHSAQVLSSDHTSSVLPTPSASLARRLQSERDHEDEYALHDGEHYVSVAAEKPSQPASVEAARGVRAVMGAPVAAPQVVPHLQLLHSSNPAGHAHPFATPQPMGDSDKLNTAATTITAHDSSAARSSESPAAVMPESYYAELSAAAAEPPHHQHSEGGPHGAARHAPHLVPPPPPRQQQQQQQQQQPLPHARAQALATPLAVRANGALYQEVFTPSYSPPAGPADGHTVPRYYLPPGDVHSCRGDAEASDSASVNPRPFSMMTATTTVASTAVTPTPFTNFLKAFAIYSFRASSKQESAVGKINLRYDGNGSSTTGSPPPPPLPGLPLILDFYRAQPLARVVAATEAQRQCRVAWGGVGNTAVQQLKRSASTAVFEELLVDELVALLDLV